MVSLPRADTELAPAGSSWDTPQAGLQPGLCASDPRECTVLTGCELCSEPRGSAEIGARIFSIPIPTAAGDKPTSTCSWFLQRGSAGEGRSRRRGVAQEAVVHQKLFLDRSSRQQPLGCASVQSNTQSSGRTPWRAGNAVEGDHTAVVKPREGV